MKALLFAALLTGGCVVNENGEADAPPPCEQAYIDSVGLKHVCESADKTRGSK